MKRERELNIYKFLKNFNLTDKSYDYFSKDLDFSLSSALSQRKIIDLGKVFSRIIGLNFVLEMKERGFREDLINNCIETVQLDVSIFISSFHSNNVTSPVQEYHENSLWSEFE